MSDVRHDSGRSRFELPTDAGVAFAAYVRTGDVWTFTHTVVPPAAEGHGVGSTLIHAALQAVDAAEGRIVPQCPFVRAYLERHPEWQRLLVE